MEKPVCAQQLSEALGNTQGKPPGRIWESICESCKGVRPLCDECVEIRRKKLWERGHFITLESTFNSS